MYKFMILTSSVGNPRSFPTSEKVELEETYPYLIRNKFSKSTFWQLSYGNISTSKLVNQPMGYLSNWKPDIIIVQSGIADCRPEIFNEKQLSLIEKITGPFYGYLRKLLFHPKIISLKQNYRLPKSSFKRTLKRFKLVFPKSKIFWLEISTGDGYENFRPGMNERKKEYNKIIKEIYGDNFILVQDKLSKVSGFNCEDHVHLNKNGHTVIAEVLLKEISLYLDSKL